MKKFSQKTLWIQDNWVMLMIIYEEISSENTLNPGQLSDAGGNSKEEKAQSQNHKLSLLETSKILRESPKLAVAMFPELD